jgi:hypothetical protein
MKAVAMTGLALSEAAEPPKRGIPTHFELLSPGRFFACLMGSTEFPSSGKSQKLRSSNHKATTHKERLFVSNYV